MRRFMAVGGVGTGKTTLCRRLLGLGPQEKKTQTAELLRNCLDTPGEYLEHRGFYRALSVLSVDCDLILLLMPCGEKRRLFPDGISALFTRPVLGVATKLDLAQSESDVRQTEDLLRCAGAQEVFRVSCATGQGLERLRKALE